LTTEKTASCHRTNHHAFDINALNFHNTPEKIQDRERIPCNPSVEPLE
jgi:hypothetical protein